MRRSIEFYRFYRNEINDLIGRMHWGVYNAAGIVDLGLSEKLVQKSGFRRQMSSRMKRVKFVFDGLCFRLIETLLKFE